MDIDTLRQYIAQRDSISILETVDVHTGVRSALKEFDYVIEAPNWTRDGKFLVYNSKGCLYRYELSTGEIRKMDTGFAVDCNNAMCSHWIMSGLRSVILPMKMRLRGSIFCRCRGAARSW